MPRKATFRRGMRAPLLLLLSAGAAALALQAAPAPIADQAAPPEGRLLPAAAPAAADILPAPQPTTLPGVQVAAELPVHRWLEPGEFVWQDEGAPAGSATIVVNLRARVLSVYRSGVEIGRSSITYGAGEKPTPTGTFPILEKDAEHYSNIYDGAPMPHMLRLTMDGIAIHGSEIADDIATRGCIGLPKEFAALLFGAVTVGDQVIIWKGDRLPVA